MDLTKLLVGCFLLATIYHALHVFFGVDVLVETRETAFICSDAIWIYSAVWCSGSCLLAFYNFYGILFCVTSTQERKRRHMEKYILMLLPIFVSGIVILATVSDSCEQFYKDEFPQLWIYFLITIIYCSAVWIIFLVVTIYFACAYCCCGSADVDVNNIV